VHQLGDQPWSYYDARSTNHQYLFICLFVFRVTAPSGPGPPHSRGF